MKIILQYDPSFANAPAGEKAAIEQAAAILDNLITDPITVTIDVGLDEAGGDKFPLGALGLDNPTGEQFFSYSQVVSALSARADTPLAQQILASLPSSAQAGQQIGLFPAQAYALGLSTPAAGAVDGYIGFRSDLAVDGQLTLYLHELGHALGRVREDSLMSLYSYSASGVLAQDPTTTPAVSAYFSIDGGKTNLATYNSYDPSDWGDLTNPTYTGGATNIDLLTALGFHINPAPSVTSQIPFQNWGTGGSFSAPVSANFFESVNPQTYDFFHSTLPMTYSATLADGSALPSWLSFNPTTLTFSGALPSGFSTTAIKLTASNALGSASEIFDAGTAIRVSTNATISEHLTPGAYFSLNLDSFFTGPVTSQTQFYVALAQSVGLAYNIWNQTDLPSWMHLDSATHTLSGTMPMQGGLYDLEVAAWNTDGNVTLGGANTLLGFTTASIDLSTISLPKAAAKTVVTQVVSPGQNFTIQLPNPVFTDSSGTIVNITLGGQDFFASTQYSSPSQLPWTIFDPTTATISGTAPSSGSNVYHLQLTATDSNNAVGGEDLYVFIGPSITTNQLYVLNAVGIPIPVHIVADTVANILYYAGFIGEAFGSGGIQEIQFTDPGTVTLSANQIGILNSGGGSLVASISSKVAFQDSAFELTVWLDKIESLAVSGSLSTISLTDSGTPTLALSAAQFAKDVPALEKLITPYNLQISGALSAGNAVLFASHLQGALAIGDSAANVSANFDMLESLAKSGHISSIALTDSGVPALSITTEQVVRDAEALKDIAGSFSVVQIAPANSTTIAGLSAVQGNSVEFSGSAKGYTITATANGVTVADASSGLVDHLINVQALQFNDATLIVAQTPGPASAVTTGNVTELYSAVLGREPDVGGLEFYQTFLAAHPGTGLTAFAQWFLASSEYAGNPTHDYAQTTEGEAQFITDSYQNLLHRTASASDIAYYQNVITPFLQNLTPGTAAYARADMQAHALVLTYFSQSPEFLSNVQVTAQNPASAQHWLLLG